MKRGILLIQLGSPDAPEPREVRAFLREFLSDPMVVDLPRWLWLPILFGPILTFRPRKTAELYRSIWSERGSPLVAESLDLVTALRDELRMPVALGMRYGNPDLGNAFDRLRSDGVEQALAIPLFPQYSMSTSGTALRAAREASGSTPVEYLEQYATDPNYIQALATSVLEHERRDGAPAKWLLSFHGIPERFTRQGDPYREHCEATAAALAGALEWTSDRWEMAFQSRFGPEPWLQPYTDERLEALGAEGLESVAVLCPGFAADCLETLEEIGVRGRESFQEAGGGELRLVPCLNASPAWVAGLAAMIRERDDFA